MSKRIRLVGKRQLYRKIAKCSADVYCEVQKEIQSPQSKNDTVTISCLPSTSCDDKLNEYSDESLSAADYLNVSLNENHYLTDEPSSNNNNIVQNLPLLPDHSKDNPLETDLTVKLQQWVINSSVSHIAVTNLLHILAPLHTELPLDCRTLMRTPICMISKPLENGNYCHCGLETALKRFLSWCTVFPHNTFEISFNIDGLPLFHSSKIEFWPILGRIMNFKSETFAIGIFCGTSKPSPLEVFLEDFITEINNLQRNGFEFSQKMYFVKVHSFICDAPARAYLRKVKSHSGYSSCDKCMEHGEYIEGRVIMRGISATKRTDLTFHSQLDEEHHLGVSPLLKLSVGLVTKFPIDYMHCVLLGIMRKLLQSWLSGRPSIQVKLSSKLTNLISDRLISVKKHIPAEFNRKPRGLEELPRWKATKYRTFLLYVGPIVLKDLVDIGVYEHFLLFHCAITILISETHIAHFGCEFAKQLLNSFINHCEQIYGLAFFVYNLHILSHLASDVEIYGALDNFSAFPFENYLGQLKHFIKSPTNPLQQVYRRLQEINMLPKKPYTPDPLLIHEQEHTLGPLPCINYRCKQFKKIRFKSFTFTIKSHSIADCYCMMKNNTVVQILNIIQNSEGNTMIVGKKFLSNSSFYLYPIDSKELHIFSIKKLSNDCQMWNSKDISAKCLVLPIPSSTEFVSFPLIHSL